ncbi:MAG: hypothetical protein LQ351_000587 [Letrouitia transgressa]|nr:MAG: hypothetical protein LQ351_000587 [Letrouitia transgressa]
MPTGDPAIAEDGTGRSAAASEPAEKVTEKSHGTESYEQDNNIPSSEQQVKEEPPVDDFGLPIKPPRRRLSESDSSVDGNTQNEDSNQDGGVTRSSPDSPHSEATPHDLSSEAVPGSTGEESPSSPRSIDQKPKVFLETHRGDHAPTGQPALGVPNHPTSATINGVSGWSHQALAPQKEVEEKHEEDEWQEMPALAPYDLYDDDGRLIAREARESDEEENAYTGLGGAGKGYTRVQDDEDAQSQTSMDENTSYLFKPKHSEAVEDDDEQRDPLAQMQATKDLLTEGQRIAYVGVTRLAMAEMVEFLVGIEPTKGTKKELRTAAESIKMWSQQMMVRLYSHMDIDTSEQIMIEQLADHGVQPGDLTPALMQNARVKNPMTESTRQSTSSSRPDSVKQESMELQAHSADTSDSSPIPAYDENNAAAFEVQTPFQLPNSKNIDIDLRWTVLCDLFLLLIADSVYDARSRTLLETVGKSLDVPWLDICRFEKRVTDSLEMQEAANKETWNESEHMENRRKQALKRRYMMMGLATVGGSLVIGLSAGLLAPVIGAGLAAGFTTIGVAGTSGFLAGAGGTALITSGAVVTGGTIAVRASNRRTGAVKTFEYRPLHNNKRVNLIVTISGWMNGKVDDVRLPYSTIDPVMGDMYSVLWEPEMLQSMGDTIKVLATEALTQGLQQVLGSTILVALMASLQLPIVLTKLSYLIDNPWTVSCARAVSAGLILADSLIDRNLGVRPITLVGFSLGCRVIFSALRELAKRGAYGLVQNVYMFGSPIVANKDEYLRARMVVSGRFVNGYASNDWILGYLFRATSGGIMRVAGLAPVEGIPGLENIDVTKLVNGHMAYRAAMPKLLREVGWEIESDEFTEIEDPDPENHEKRQRELIRELDEARKDAEKKPEKRRFGLFKRGKLAEKKKWEMYDDSMRDEDPASSSGNENGSNNVLFDIEAIKKELASEQIEVKQLESTLPPIQLRIKDFSTREDLKPSPYSTLRESKSFDSTMVGRPKLSGHASQSSLPNGHTSNPFNQGYDEYNISTGSVLYAEKTVENKKPSEGFGSPGLPSEPPTASAQSTTSAPPSLDSNPMPQRPSSTSSTTLPAGNGALTLEHNAWLDEDDEDFGKEREITMSFV